MKKLYWLFTVVAFLIASSPAAFALSSNTLYMEDSSSSLYTVDAATGAATLVGSTGIAGVTDIAFDGTDLYGITFTRFLTIDANTGSGSYVGSGLGFVGMNALAVSSGGTIYAANDLGHFILIDSAGAGHYIGFYGTGLTSSGDLAFDYSSGVLYASLNAAGQANDILATINLGTGAASLIGDIGYNDVFGLSFRNGTLYGATGSGDLLTINTSTGSGIFVGSNSINQWGMSTSPVADVPEPATILLLGSGLIGLGFFRRKTEIV